MKTLAGILFIVTCSISPVLAQENAPNGGDVLYEVRSAILKNPNDYSTLMGGAYKLFNNNLFSECQKVADSLIGLDSSNFLGFQIRSSCKYELKDYAGAFEDGIQSFKLVPVVDNSIPNRRTTNTGLSTNRLEFTLFFKITGNHLKDDKYIFNYYDQIFDAFEMKINEVKESFRSATDEKEKLVSTSVDFTINSLNFKLGIFLEQCAMLYDKKGQTENAERILKRRVQIVSKWQGFQFRANYFTQKKKYAEAIADFTEAIEITNDPLQFQKEKNFFAKAGTPNYYQWKAEIYFKRGDLYNLVGDYEKAIADFESAKFNYSKLQLSYTQKFTQEIIDKNLTEKINVARQKLNTETKRLE